MAPDDAVFEKWPRAIRSPHWSLVSPHWLSIQKPATRSLHFSGPLQPLCYLRSALAVHGGLLRQPFETVRPFGHRPDGRRNFTKQIFLDRPFFFQEEEMVLRFSAFS